jgi:hypothetical protein
MVAQASGPPNERALSLLRAKGDGQCRLWPYEERAFLNIKNLSLHGVRFSLSEKPDTHHK